jgi:hypothetical protein
MEDADSNGVREGFMESSISRELQVLSSHTVHHFALIAITLRMHGVEIESDFGMAPSTLRTLHRRRRRLHSVHRKLGPATRRISSHGESR